VAPQSNPSHPLDAINRRAWRLPATVRAYERLEGWTDPGEQAAIEHVAAEMRSRPILDIGVGAGRTIAILQAISQDYVGIDYTQEMVDACRARYPGTRVMHMDARDLGGFEDNRFAFVVFSFNGIDSVDPADRSKILTEVHRVLQPGGLFLFSAHNRHGGLGDGVKPRLHLRFSWNPLRLGWRTLQLARSLPRSWRNYRRHQLLNEIHEDWAIMNCPAHEFGIVIMYTTLSEQTRQLDAGGFKVELVLDCVRGQPVTGDTDTRDVSWFHYIARKT
jgi:SAM-dependent methyltransferase